MCMRCHHHRHHHHHPLTTPHHTTLPGDGFDPASPPSAAQLAAEQKELKANLRLKASTYVAPRTKRNREAVMNDGYTLSGTIVNTHDADAARIKDLENALAKAKQEQSCVTAVMHTCCCCCCCCCRFRRRRRLGLSCGAY
jgi:hypothetical protein